VAARLSPRPGARAAAPLSGAAPERELAREGEGQGRAQLRVAGWVWRVATRQPGPRGA